MKDSLLIYGANGYSGKLVAEHAAAYGLTPILAGRDEKGVGEVAKKLNLPYRIFSLTDSEASANALADVRLVLNAAGPYEKTLEPFVAACLKTGTHYIDLNGEREPFEKALGCDQEAKARGIMVLPAVGFDVVPSDCMALFLKNQLPDATHLQLAFATYPEAAMSRGTALTLLAQLGQASMVRVDGRVVDEPFARRGMMVDFGQKKSFVVSVPWGDVITAYHTTSIPNIETYFAAGKGMFYLMKLQTLFNWALRSEGLRNRLQRKIKNGPAGPDEAKREASSSVVWGRVTNARKQSRQALIFCPEVYDVTYHASLLIAKKILQGACKSGFQTPAAVFGADLILEVPGTRRETIG